MSTRHRSEGASDGIELVQGAIYGVGAFVAGYVLTFVLLFLDSEVELDGEEYLFEVVGMVFYNAQFIDLEATDGSTTESFSMLSENSTQIPELVYTLVPVCLLLGAGYVVARGSSDRATTDEDAMKTGLSVVVGYLPLVFIGTSLFEISEEGLGQTYTVGPKTGSALIIAGLLFPVVLGAIGGYLSQR